MTLMSQWVTNFGKHVICEENGNSWELISNSGRKKLSEEKMADPMKQIIKFREINL